MKKIWVFLGFLLTSVVITGCTHYFTEEFLYDYPIKDFKKAKGIVLDIRTEKGLYTPPVYLARVELQTDHASDEIYPQELRVSKRQVMDAIDGKSISGYTSDGTDFHTLYDVVYNSSMYLLFIFIGLVLLCFTLFFGSLNTNCSTLFFVYWENCPSSELRIFFKKLSCLA